MANRRILFSKYGNERTLPGSFSRWWSWQVSRSEIKCLLLGCDNNLRIGEKNLVLDKIDKWSGWKPRLGEIQHFLQPKLPTVDILPYGTMFPYIRILLGS